jgi:hypothetical protein
LTHQPPRHRLQILVLNRILRGNDEPELVTIAIASIEESRSLCAILLGVIEGTWLSFSRDTIALQVSKVGLCTT